MRVFCVCCLCFLLIPGSAAPKSQQAGGQGQESAEVVTAEMLKNLKEDSFWLDDSNEEKIVDYLGKPLIDVRSPDEYYGLRTHMPEYPQEGVLRGGHVPGAANVPWARAAAPDGTFRPADELRAIYEGEAGLRPELDTITYCRIGERSSHTWFVLTYLLGYPNVRNYDGSWTEWGNSVRVPVER